MDTRLSSIVSAVVAIVSLPAYAGRDGTQLISQQKPRQLVSQDDVERTCSDAASQPAIRLPIDHGPRAEATPWLNQQRLSRAKAAEKTAIACNVEEHGRLES